VNGFIPDSEEDISTPELPVFLSIIYYCCSKNLLLGESNSSDSALSSSTYSRS
jgi:hypothetical protein